MAFLLVYICLDLTCIPYVQLIQNVTLSLYCLQIYADLGVICISYVWRADQHASLIRCSLTWPVVGQRDYRRVFIKYYVRWTLESFTKPSNHFIYYSIMSYKLCFHTFYELHALLLLLYVSGNTVTIAQLSNLCGYVRRYVVGVVTCGPLCCWSILIS